MMFHRLGLIKLINKNQLGFTLMELMLAIAISGIITGVITTTIYQVFTGNLRTSNHMTAVRQVQNAGYWVSYDTHMAQSIGIGDDPGTATVEEFLTLTWANWSDNETHQVVYALVDMPSGGLKNLQRSHSVDGTTGTSIIAQFVDPREKDGKPQTRCEPASGALVLTVTATVGAGSQEQSETRRYEVVPRPGS